MPQNVVEMEKESKSDDVICFSSIELLPVKLSASGEAVFN
jgi:hypothetical protein